MISLICTISIFGSGIEVYFILIILGLPLYFLFRTFFKRLVKNVRIRIVLTWTTTIILSFILYAAIISILFWPDSYYPDRRFDKAKWGTNKDERYEYSKNIIESRILIGKTRSQVKKLLGIANQSGSDSWVYILGFKPGIGFIDPSALEIDFKNGKVIKVQEYEQ